MRTSWNSVPARPPHGSSLHGTRPPSLPQRPSYFPHPYPEPCCLAEVYSHPLLSPTMAMKDALGFPRFLTHLLSHHFWKTLILPVHPMWLDALPVVTESKCLMTSACPHGSRSHSKRHSTARSLRCSPEAPLCSELALFREFLTRETWRHLMATPEPLASLAFRQTSHATLVLVNSPHLVLPGKSA